RRGARGCGSRRPGPATRSCWWKGGACLASWQSSGKSRHYRGMAIRRRAAALAVLLALALCVAIAAWNARRIGDKVLDLRYGARIPIPESAAPRDAAEAR